MCIGLRNFEKILEAIVLFVHVVTVFRAKSYFSKIKAGIFPYKAFLRFKSFTILLVVETAIRGVL